MKKKPTTTTSSTPAPAAEESVSEMFNSNKEFFECLKLQNPILSLIESDEEYVYGGILTKMHGSTEVTMGSSFDDDDATDDSSSAPASPKPGKASSPSSSPTSSPRNVPHSPKASDSPPGTPTKHGAENLMKEALENISRQKPSKKQYNVVLTKQAIYKITLKESTPHPLLGVIDENKPSIPGSMGFKEFDLTNCESTRNATVSWRLPLSFLHSVEISAYDDKAFVMYGWPNTNKVPSSKKTKKKGLCARTFICESKNERDVWVVIMQNVLQNYWQLLFERRLLEADEIYQFHMFITKFQRNGKEGTRCFIFSNKKVYHTKFQPGEPDPKGTFIRWVLPYSCFKGLKTYKQDPAAFGLLINKPEAAKKWKTAKDINEQYAFNCMDEMDRRKLVIAIRTLSFLTTGKKITVQQLATGHEKSK